MRLDELVPLIKKNISRENRNAYGNGLICLKGGELSGEFGKYAKDVMEFDLSNYFSEPYFETKKLIYLPL